MAAGGLAVPHLSQDERPGGHRREHAGAPPGRAALAPSGETRVGGQPCGPLAGPAWQEGGAGRNQLGTSSLGGALTPLQTGEA
jgi:hypothetical protein